MVENKFPIGSTLVNVFVIEDQEFAGDELCLDQVQLIFENQTIVLKPLADTDEIEVTHKPKTQPPASNTPTWCRVLIGKKLQTAWICENVQGYQDQVIFAFGRLHPSISFIAEGSVLKVFHCEPICIGNRQLREQFRLRV